MSHVPVRLVVAMIDDVARQELHQLLPEMGFEVVGVFSTVTECVEQTNAMMYLPDLVITDMIAGLETITEVFTRRHVTPAFVGLITNDVVPDPEAEYEYVLCWYDWPLSEALLNLVIQTSFQFSKQLQNIQAKINALSQELADREIITEAVGILEIRFGLTRQESWDYLTRLATSRGWKKVAMARQLVAANKLFYP